MSSKKKNFIISSKKCILCKKTVKNKLKYGEFIVKNKIGVHYYCLLLSSSLTQGGSDNEGYLGFLIRDIKKEATRVKNLKCCYCKQASANIGCCDKKCRKTFHLICGIEKGAQSEFCETFRSFCHAHRRTRNYFRLPKSNKELFKLNCAVCFEKFDNSHIKANYIQLPCCKNGWFHKWCMQEYADNAGYFIKCPLCNNVENFIKYLKLFGIFISEKDAEWELESNAYEELLERPKICNVKNCLCPDGRETDDLLDYEFLYCSTCGSVARHKICNSNQKSFNCNECNEILPNQNDDNADSNSDSGIIIIDDDEEMADCSNMREKAMKQANEIAIELQTVLEKSVIDIDDYEEKIVKLREVYRLSI